jgi:hypothetical protein
MPTNPFDLDSLDLQVSPIQGAGDQVEPQKTPIISALSFFCCAILTVAFSCIPGLPVVSSCGCLPRH